MKGGFGRVHGDSASFAINPIARDGEYGPRYYPMYSGDSESFGVSSNECTERRRCALGEKLVKTTSERYHIGNAECD